VSFNYYSESVKVDMGKRTVMFKRIFSAIAEAKGRGINSWAGLADELNRQKIQCNTSKEWTPFSVKNFYEKTKHHHEGKVA